MAEHPELWRERAPERLGAGHLFGHAPAFGVAREAERMPHDMIPDLSPPPRRTPRRERGPFLTYLQLPWSYGDRNRGDLWHRMQCRRRRHEMIGGYCVPMNGTAVFVDRRCRWCGIGVGEARPSRRQVSGTDASSAPPR